VGPEALKRQVRLISFAEMWAWLVPLLLVILIAAIIVRNRQTLGRWLGYPFLGGGLQAILPALVYRPIITSVLGSGVLSETPDLIRVEAVRIILRLADAIFQPLLTQAIVVIVVAIALIVVGILAKPKQATAEPQPAETV